jgi:hypothetical protein
MSDIKHRTLDFILILLLIIKVIWVVAMFTHFINKKYYNNIHESFIIEIESTFQNMYTLFIGVLLIYLYNHLTPSKVCVEGHAKLYLYTFGILSCIGIVQKAIHKYHFSEDLTMIENIFLENNLDEII